MCVSILQTTRLFLLNCLVFIIAVNYSAVANAENLLQNPTFDEQSTKQDQPIANWDYRGWQLDLEKSSAEIIKESNQTFVAISHKEDAHTYLIQDFWLEPNTMYRFSARMKSLNVGYYNRGANISIVGQTVVAGDLRENSKWQRYDMYIHNGKEKKQIALMLSLGHYGSVNIGTAFFDDVILEKVDTLLSGIQVARFGNPKAYIQTYYLDPPKDKLRLIALLSSASVIFLGLLFYLKIHYKKKEKNSLKETIENRGQDGGE